MRYGSVCSGVEAATLAWHHLGWRPAFFSEIDAFPSAVLKDRWPDVENLGDMNNFKEWPHEEIDILVGGTPCQSFSVSGLRRGLEDPRGNLALVFLAIIEKYRPKWVVWENVPGVLSSAGGRDFGAFLGGLEKLGYGFAYRVLDAKYFGVPQQRRRVFVVGCAGNWSGPRKVLFESPYVPGDSEPRRDSEETASGSTKAGSRTTITGRMTPIVCHETQSPCMLNDTAFTLGRIQGQENGICVQGAIIRSGEAKGGPAGSGWKNDGSSFTLLADTHPHAVVSPHNVIRRLTPKECERLQGFPDDHTNIMFKGKPATDGHRYKACGNSMAVPVMRWIGERIQQIEANEASQ